MTCSTRSPSSIPSLPGRYTPSSEALESSKSARRVLYTCCRSVNTRSSERFAGVELLRGAVALLVLLLAGHAQGLRRYLLEVALPGDEHADRVVLHGLLVRVLGQLVGVDYARVPGRGVVLYYPLQLLDDDVLELAGGSAAWPRARRCRARAAPSPPCA